MDDVIAMLPVMKVAADRITDTEAQKLIDVFLTTIQRLSDDLIKYSSVSPSGVDLFLFNRRSWS